MNLIDNFFKEMEDLFLESDKSSFYELKEDLYEHINIQLSEGKTEEEVILSLGSPQAIVNDFYEDQRLHTAMTAEKDVVPIEQVKKAYKNEKKGKRKTLYSQLRQALKIGILFLSIVIVAFFSSSFIHEGIFEHYFALAPFTLAVFFSGISLLIWRIMKHSNNQKNFYTIGITLILSLISIAYLTFTHSWFHNGAYHKAELTLTSDQLLNLTINSDYHVEVMTIPISSNKQARIEVQGYMHHSVSKELKDLQSDSNRIAFHLGKQNIFNYFARPKKNEITLYLPQSTKLNTLDLNLKNANLQLNNIIAKKILLDIKEGDIQIGNLQSDKMTINSHTADIFMTNYATSLSINNRDGKSILKNGQGKASIHSLTGLVNIQNTTSTDFTIDNQSGKSVLNDTLIQNLAINNQDGTLVLENQSGNSTIQNHSGKLILNNNSGFIKVQNQSGALIISQDKKLTGEIKSDDGLVKWVQLDTVPLAFILKSDSGKIVNEFGETPESNAKADITVSTKSGEIRVIKKNNNNSTKDPEASKF